MSTSKIYRFCDGNDIITNTTITLTEGSCNYDSNWQETQNNGAIVSTWTKYIVGITFTASVAPVGDVEVFYSYTEHYESQYYGGSTNVDYPVYTSVILPSGQTSLTVFHTCSLENVYRDYNDGRMDENYIQTDFNFIITDQQVQPSCGLQPEGCGLEITSYVVSAPSQRGLTNGSIAVVLSGCTGTTDNVNYYINGVLTTSSGSTTGFTFSNLAAGVYTVYVNQEFCYDQVIGLVVPEGEFRTGYFYTETEPADLVAADNPIINNVTTKIINPQATKNKVKFTIAGTVSNNTQIKINLTSPFAYTQTFYGKHFPNKTNYFLASTLTNNVGVPVGTNSASEIAVSLAQVLQNDSVISKVYYVENTANEVFLTARENGSRFNLVQGNNVTISSGITFTTLITGQDKYDGQLTDNYNIYMEVFTNSNSNNQYPELGTNLDYVRIAELSMPFSQNNQHKFNLSEIVKTQVSTPMPNNGQSMAIMSEPLRSFYCKLGEVYPLVANTNTLKKRYKQESSYFWAINSSLDREVVNDMTAYIGSAGNYLGVEYKSNVLFLTNSQNITINRTSQQFLYFLLEKNYGNLLSLKADIYYNDGSQTTNASLRTITSTPTNAGGVCMVNVGWDSLGLSSFEGNEKKIMYYDIKIVQQLGTYGYIPYTQTKRYYVSENASPEKFGIHFQNRLGMYDSFDFIGVVEETVDRETTTYTKPLSYGNSGNVPVGYSSKTINTNKVTKKVVVNTGWVDAQTFKWLNELNMSKSIYSYTEQYINYLVLTDLTYSKSTVDDMYNVTCTFTHTIWENAVSI